MMKKKKKKKKEEEEGNEPYPTRQTTGPADIKSLLFNITNEEVANMITMKDAITSPSKTKDRKKYGGCPTMPKEDRKVVRHFACA